MRATRPLVVGVLIVSIVLVGVVAYRAWSLRAGAVDAGDLTRVLLVAAAPDDTGAVVGQIITIADLTVSPTALEPVSPALAVAIPGTTYSTLGDAYPFGGGAGTADALARAQGGDALPYAAISAEAFGAALEAAGTVTVTLPAAMSVFDGEDLYTFDAGKQQLTPDEVLAALKGAPYLTERERAELDASLSAALVEVLIASPGTLERAETDLTPEAIARLQAAL